MESENKRSFRILIVEDDIVDAKVLQRQLTQTGLSITSVAHTDYLEKALNLLTEQEFDVVLLDMNLPDSSGLETLRKVHRAKPHLTIINVTGGSDEKLALEALANGAQDYLVKGRFDPYVLNKSIQYSIERKKTEQALRESTGKLDAMLGAISDHMTMLDKNMTVIWANEAAKNAFGQEIVGQKCYEAYHKTEKCPRNECALKSAFEDGKVHDWYSDVTFEDGSARYFHSTANVAIRDDEGYPEAVIEISRDITKAKLAENNLISANKELENANQELKEMQGQVVQNEKLASIGQLAAGVAHEMNTPVGFVVSNFSTLQNYVNKFQTLLTLYGKLVREVEACGQQKLIDTTAVINETRGTMKMDFIEEDIVDLFAESKEGLERVTGIIQNLRDFSRVDQAESFDFYDINNGMEATLTVARNEIKYDAEVTTDFCESMPVRCNAGQVNQVFLNVLVNASHAIKGQEREGKGNINIKTYPEDDWAVIVIQDDGPGIPQEVINKVFDPFFTTKPAGKGTGLGLSVSHDIIVNKHKGQLFVESDMGKGARFTIKLPLTTEQIENEEPVLVGVQTNGE